MKTQAPSLSIRIISAAMLVIGALLVYAALAVIFGWLLFVARGLPAKRG